MDIDLSKRNGFNLTVKLPPHSKPIISPAIRIQSINASTSFADYNFKEKYCNGICVKQTRHRFITQYNKSQSGFFCSPSTALRDFEKAIQGKLLIVLSTHSILQTKRTLAMQASVTSSVYTSRHSHLCDRKTKFK